MSVEHFNDIQNEIKELGCVASLVVIEATKISRDVFKDAEFYPSVLQVLTHLVAQQLKVETVKDEYKQRERQRAVNKQIEESVKRMQANRF